MFSPKRKDEPIIGSLMDSDFYKLAMAQVVHLKHGKVPVRYALTNRTKSVQLARQLDIVEVKEHLDHARTLRFGNSDLHYLRGTNEYEERMFAEPFLDFLRGYQLPDYFLESRDDGQFELGVDDLWEDGILWETIMLTVLTELHTRNQLDKLSIFEQDRVWANAQIRLAEKIDKLKAAHNRGVVITLSDFGTRRRASCAWQDYVVQALRAELPEGMFRGTSNVYLADKHDLLPMGTNAHEMPMVYSGIYHQEDDDNYEQGNPGLPSLEHFLTDWEEVYGLGLSIALADTYGSKYFFDHIFTEERLKRWKGSRHDSGSPVEYGEMMVERYLAAGIDPKDKMIIYSDGLDVDSIINLAERFDGRILTSYGWGTNATNDIGFKTLSLVIKSVFANGHGLAKLSDNLEKAVGYTPEDIERMKRLNHYDVHFAKTCTY